MLFGQSKIFRNKRTGPTNSSKDSYHEHKAISIKYNHVRDIKQRICIRTCIVRIRFRKLKS